MEYMQQYTCEAKVIDVQIVNGTTAILLDQTVFYPQGGGQPCDRGIIKTTQAVFEVREVRYIDGVVYHYGSHLSGEVCAGDTVICEVDVDRRKVNTRLHSIGHLIDVVVYEREYDWTPAKGYHFPEGAYVEYVGNITGKDVAALMQEIEEACSKYIGTNIETRIAFGETQTPDGKPLRTVYYGTYGVPCGGTHVAHLGEIVSVMIRKIKQDKDRVRISYE